MSQAPHYLDVLTHEIGPRPVASDTERQAAEWLQDRFAQAGIPSELHDFDAPRSPQSARMLTYLLVPLALLGIGAGFLEQMWVIHWLCWALLVALSMLTVLDLFGPKGPAGLIAFLPKSPSQNVIAKSVPSSYTPGEKTKKVILVANYDSELTSPLSAEATVALQRPIQAIANIVVIVMPALAMFLIPSGIALIPSPAMLWVSRIALILCIPGMLLFINQLIARVMNRYSPGANNNASGVAAVLATMDLLAEGQQGQLGHTAATSAVKLKAAEAKAANVARQSSKMPGIDYTAPTGSIPKTTLSSAPTLAGGDVGLEEAAMPSPRPGRGTAPFESVAASTAPASVSTEGNFPSFETVEFSGLGDSTTIETAPSYAALDDYDAQESFATGSVPALGTEVLDAGIIGAPIDVGDTGGAADDVTEPRGGRSSREKKPSRSERSKRSSGREGRSSKASQPRKEKKSFFSFGKQKHDSSLVDDPSNWLGLDQGFDARKDGKSMGSWDNFGGGTAMADDAVDLTDSFSPLGGTGGVDSEPQFVDTVMSPPPPAPSASPPSTPSPPPLPASDAVVDLTDSFSLLSDDDDHFSWKGGFAGDDPIEDSDYASAEAARIRRKVVDSLDVDLKEKEVWFVLTGAHFAQRAGIRAFMNDYGDQLRDALFINISAVGSGDLYWSTKERFGRSYVSSARLTSMLRRISRDSQIGIKPWKKGAIISDAGPILAAGRKAISISRLGDKGLSFAFASSQDTAARLDSSKIDEVAELTCNIIREV